MAQKVLVIGSILFFSLIGKVVFPEIAQVLAFSTAVEIDPAVERQILDATVRISVFAPAVDENGQLVQQIADGQKHTVYDGGTGLGTLVQMGNEMVIITHDHWRLLFEPKAFVEFTNAAGELLLTMSGPDVTSLIRYRDGGTIILNAPQEVASKLQPVLVGNNIEVNKRDTVFIVYRHSDGSDKLSVQAMSVTETKDADGIRAFEMRGREGTIITTGNSGGGVWQDGQLVGNMWSTVLEQRTDGSGEAMPTNLSLAAELPVIS
jgi:hypothetical protein